jgi:hypothetical protein
MEVVGERGEQKRETDGYRDKEVIKEERDRK